MRNANSVILLAVAAGTLAGCHTAPPTVSDNVMACGKIADTAQRYRCYDSLNTSMRPAPSARPPRGGYSFTAPVIEET